MTKNKPNDKDVRQTTILVTGATGFVGRFLCLRLMEEGYSVRGTLLQSEEHELPAAIKSVVITPLGPDTIWEHILSDVDVVIHLAARVHIMDDPASDPLLEFRKVNVEGTRRLASEAARAGVKRFVFVSSIKVNGEESGEPFTPFSTPNPSDAYGISKWEAEVALREIEQKTGLDVVVVRPTLVYGPGVKANFLRMMQILQRSIPLPFASIKNKRSLVYVGNLVDALAACACHPAAAGKTYMVSDDEDVSTADILSRTAMALGIPARLFPVPISLIRVAGALSGRGPAVRRLVGSLVVDISNIKRDLNWDPPFTMDEGLRETASWFRKQSLL